MNRVETELLPCPFCGSPASLEHDSDHHGEWFNLGCSKHWEAVGDDESSCPGGRLWYTANPSEEPGAIAAWNRRAPIAAGSGEATELDQLREYAKAATIAITGLTGGGSEYFSKQIGDIYTADLDFCVKRIRESKEAANERWKAARLELTALRAALSAAGAAEPDPSFPDALPDNQIRVWINACNHEPARQALRQLLAYRIRGVSAPLFASPPSDTEEKAL